jgi:hypothetical protein
VVGILDSSGGLWRDGRELSSGEPGLVLDEDRAI